MEAKYFCISKKIQWNWYKTITKTMNSRIMVKIPRANA